MKPLSPELRARILASAQASPAPTRRDFNRQTALALGVSAAVSLGIFFAIGGYRQGRRPESYVAGVAVATGLAAFVVSYFAMRRGKSTLGRPLPVLAGLAAAAPLALMLISVVAGLVWPESNLADDDRSDLRCASWAGLMGAAPLVAFLWARRGVMFAQPFWVSAAVGGGSFAFGSLLIMLRCTCATLPHLLVGHVLPVAVFGALSGYIGAKVLARAAL